MKLTTEDATAYLFAEKRLLAGHDWRRKQNRDGKYPILFYEARVSIDGALPRGLRFRISIFPTYPNVATFQLEIDIPGSRTCMPLYRLEWQPLSGHSNGRNCSPELQDLIFKPGDTHEHLCTDNLSHAEGRVLKSGVQAARGLDHDFGSFDEALSYVCDKLNIQNPGDIPPSEAQAELFE